MSKSNPSIPNQVEVRKLAGVTQMQPHAAGVDIGAREIWVCVPGPGNTQQVRRFGSYTVDLLAIAAWLRSHAIETVAMESTGIYWIPLFELLESRGFECCLISSRSIRRIPGRKSDIIDCQWIQTLHSHGLLESSFRPEADLVALRTLLRHRSQLIEHRSPHILHMQKALLQMNIQLTQVLSDITGQTGLNIIRAIVAGERDPYKLAALRNYRCKKSADQIAKALTGSWREEHLFTLQQSLALFDFYTQQILSCDAEIERLYRQTRPAAAGEDAEMPPPSHKRRSHSKNGPQNEHEIRRHLKRIAGVDLTAVDGLNVSLAQTILMECGTDMRKFPNSKHFCSWLGLAPRPEISGGKVLRNRIAKTHNRAGQAFRRAAASLTRADCAFGAFYRRQKARLGPAQALVATAHFIARVVYRMLKSQVEYDPISAQEYDARYKERQIAYLHKKAAKLGFKLSPV